MSATSLSSQPDVVIAGGGAVGICCAYFLLEHGFSVTLVEKGEVGAGSSYGNAGLIVPSHAVPLSAPGVWKQGIKWMLDPASPLYIKPRLDMDLFRWLLLFLAATKPQRQPPAIRALSGLSHASRALFAGLSALDGMGFGFEHRGGLALYCHPEALEGGAEEAHLLREHGVGADVLDAEGVRRIEPNVLPSVIGGVYFPPDAHLIPHEFVQQLARRVQERGGVIQPHTEVTGFHTQGRRVTGVLTSNGTLTPREVVLASGAWSPAVARDLRLKLPIQPAKGYSLTVKATPDSPSVPLHLSELKVVVTPMGDKIRFAGTLELAGLDFTIQPRRLEGIKRGVGRYLPMQAEWPTAEIWRGLRPLTPDTLPIIGRTMRYDNLILATGHGMLGVSLAPVTGQLIAEVAAQQPPSHDLSLLSPDRF